MKMIKQTGAACAALALAFVTPSLANAAVTFTSSGFDSAPAAGESLVMDFDSAPAAGYAISGGAIYQGTQPNVAAAPAGDPTNYYAVLGGHDAVFTSQSGLSALSFYMGSIDSYNTVTFSGQNGFTQSFTGSQLYEPANGNQSSAETNRRFDFSFNGASVNKVTFSSSQNSLELDNIAVRAISAAPEPSTWALMMLGVGFIGWALGYSKRVPVGRHAKRVVAS